MILSQGQSEADDSDHIFLAFARVLLTGMEEVTVSQPLPATYYSMTFFYEDSWPDEPDSQHISWVSPPIEKRTNYMSLIILSSRNQLWASKEAQEYVTYWKQVVGNPLNVNMSLFENVSASLQVYMFLLRGDFLVPILDVLEQHDTFHPTQEQLLDRFHCFRDERTNANVYWDITVPLFNVIGDVQHKETLGSFSLSLFTTEEKTKVWNTFERQSLNQRNVIPIDINAFSNTFFQLTTTYTEPQEVHQRRDVLNEMIESITRPNYIPPRLIDIFKELEDIITALRLVYAGNVQPLGLIERLRTTFYQKERGSIYMLHEQYIKLYTQQYGPICTLHETDFSTMKICFDTLRRLRMQNGGKDKPHGQLSVALRRLNQSYNREQPEDQIIDLTIALEGSLLAGLRDELNYRLSLRGAALLALRGKWEPNKSQNLLKAMYSVRSSIVHSGQLLSELENDIKKLQCVGIQPHEFPQQCKNIVRDVLKEYVLREGTGQSMKQVNEELDKHIVESLRLQPHLRGQMTNE